MPISRSAARLCCPTEQERTVRVLVFAKNAKADEAQAAGADYVGAEELIPKIQNEGWLDFDVVVATPDMMGVVGRLGRVLGPKGLMPNPKAGTVTMDVAKAIADIKAGKIEYRLDKTNIVHVPLGKASFTEEQLSDNFQTLMSAIIKSETQCAEGPVPEKHHPDFYHGPRHQGEPHEVHGLRGAQDPAYPGRGRCRAEGAAACSRLKGGAAEKKVDTHGNVC